MKEYPPQQIEGTMQHFEQKVSNPPSEQVYIGGIPIEFKKALALSQGETYQEVVTGIESGHPISVLIGSHNIEIKDMTNYDFHFQSTFRDKADLESTENCIKFDIRTVDRGYWKHRRNVRQPDFRAYELAQFSIEYFEARHSQINEIEFFWEGYKKRCDASDNYLKYHEVKRNIMEKLQTEGISEDQALNLAQQEAALSTWTGQRLAVQRGLMCVRDIEENWAVIGKFVRAN